MYFVIAIKTMHKPVSRDNHKITPKEMFKTITGAATSLLATVC